MQAGPEKQVSEAQSAEKSDSPWVPVFFGALVVLGGAVFYRTFKGGKS